LQSLGLSNAVVRTRVVTSDAPGLLALSRLSNTPDFVAALDRALQAMMNDGSYKRIRERFVPCVTSAETVSCR
jgi:polar amino acid transport system substrate-binding protein